MLICYACIIFSSQTWGTKQYKNTAKNDITAACSLAAFNSSLRFPEKFQFGVSTAAYQIEGGWNADGKGPSIWDTFTHQNAKNIADHSNADVAADSYHKFEQDLKALKELKVHFYRFSISWPRILPNGDISSKNQQGIDYYNNIINKLLENGIEPMVTMYHYDMPEELNKFGGLTNNLFVKYFRSYANVLFESYGDRVKTWITFNEPIDYCIPGYGDGSYPPKVHAPGIADYLCMDITLKSHVAAYQLYRSKYFAQQAGKVGITMSSRYFFARRNNTHLIDRAMQYSLGWLGHPLYSESGNYPRIMLRDIRRNSRKEGRAWPRLRSLNKNMIKLFKGSADFLGLNYYTSRLVEQNRNDKSEIPSWQHDSHMKYIVDKSWRRAKSSWLYCVPEGLEGLLNWIRVNYNNIEVMITENGWSDNGELNDMERIDYIKAHLQAVLNALNSGCNVTRYTHWSLIDNFEWLKGYTEKFGLYYVNMTSANRERIAKKSATFYRRIIEQRAIPET